MSISASDRDRIIAICKNNFIDQSTYMDIVRRLDSGDKSAIEDLRAIKEVIFDEDEISDLNDIITCFH